MIIIVVCIVLALSLCICCIALCFLGVKFSPIQQHLFLLWFDRIVLVDNVSAVLGQENTSSKTAAPAARETEGCREKT